MRRALLLVAALWLAILGGMVAINEHTLRTGREIVLKTVPVDPRDLFRGDYVTLRYDISRLQACCFTAGQNCPALNFAGTTRVPPAHRGASVAPINPCT